MGLRAIHTFQKYILTEQQQRITQRNIHFMGPELMIQ